MNSILQGELSQIKEKYSRQKLNLESKLRVAQEKIALRVAQEKIALAETELKALTTETALLVERGDKIFSGIVPVRSFSGKRVGMFLRTLRNSEDFCPFFKKWRLGTSSNAG